MGQSTRQGIQSRWVFGNVSSLRVEQDSVRVGQLAEDTYKPYELGSSTLTHSTFEALELSLGRHSAQHIGHTVHPCSGSGVLVTLWIEVMQQTGTEADEADHLGLDTVVDGP